MTSCLAIVLLLVLGSLPAFAQSGEEGSSVAPLRGAADASAPELEEALDAYARGDLDQANRLLEQVHMRSPSARTLRGLGVVAFQQQRYADAEILLEQSLVHAVKPLDPDLRASVQQLLALCRTHLGHVTLNVVPLDAELSVDGQPTPFVSGRPITVAVGAHEFRLNHPRHVAKTLSVAVSAASELALEVTLDPEPPPAPRPQAGAGEGPSAPAPLLQVSSPSTPAPAPEKSSRARALKWTGYLSSALGLVAFGGALTSALVAARRVDEVQQACSEQPGGTCTTTEVNRREADKQLPRLGRIATAGLILGGSASVAGVTLLVLAHRHAPGQPTALFLGLRLRI